MLDDVLVVKLHGEPIGLLTPTKTGARFQFDEAIVEKSSGLPALSTSLLVQRESFDAEATKNWFSGLLPEDSRLDEIKRFFGIEGDSYLAALAQVGWECAGAVAVMPADAAVRACKASGAQSISPAELCERLIALPSHPYDTAETLRISLGGFQEKLCVIASELPHTSQAKVALKDIKLPVDGALSTHILKPQPNRFPGMIIGEAWAMAAASLAAPTAKTALLSLLGAPETLVVERFDRVLKSGGLHRIHQEDCAQAMGLSPEHKYAASGSPKKSDPTFKRIAALLSQFSSNPTKELENLLGQILINVCLGNTDAHAKNFAFLHPDESTLSLAPLYDVVPAREITPGVINMGMRIDGRIRIDRIEREQIENEARSWGLSALKINATIEEVTEKLRFGIEQANNLYPFAGKAHAEAAIKRIETMRK